MESETLQIKISKLIQKSRQAVRLYSSVTRPHPTSRGEFTDFQVAEWKEINMLLVQTLSSIMDIPGKKSLSSDVFAVKEKFYTLWRSAEGDLQRTHADMLHAVEKSDYFKIASLGCELISLRARVQATQAAYNELQVLLGKSRVTKPAVELSHNPLPEEKVKKGSVQRSAKVIPITRRRVNGI